MSLTIQKANVTDIKPTLGTPSLGFVHDAIAGGTAYKIGADGYFVVAAQQHPFLPQFVVDVRLPELPNLSSFKWVALQMLKNSGGMLYIDSSNSDAFALAWRLQLQLLPASPLLQYSPKAAKFSTAVDVVREASPDDNQYVGKLLNATARQRGGLAQADLMQFVQQKQAYVLENRGRSAGAAVVVPQGSSYAWLEAFALDPSVQRSPVSYTVFEKLALKLQEQKRSLIFGMSHLNAGEYVGSMKLGATMIGQSYHAFLPTACADFKLAPAYT